MPFDHALDAPLRIAVIGGGISGLACARALSGHHQVTLIEADQRLGGHARTVIAGRHRDQPVDTGFIVFNHVNYPHLTGMFRDLDVPVKRSDMSFGVSLDNGRFEYALRSGNALLGQRRNALRPAFWSMVRDIMRFNATAHDAAAGRPDLTIEALLEELGLGSAFRDLYLYPICGAIWSTPGAGIGVFPAEALIRFMRNHGLMQARGRHGWWTVDGGSRAYVDRVEQDLRRRGVELRTGAPVVAVRREATGVSVRCMGGTAEHFHHVVMACHADQSLRLLENALPAETGALGAIRFQDNRMVLHADSRVMPRRRRCWSSWVYREAAEGQSAVGVSYWMNRLQGIDPADPLFVSLNPADDLDPALVQDEHVFRHPVFDHAALRAQAEIARMQGTGGIWHAGAWLRNGFHEDGFATALRVSSRLCGRFDTAGKIPA